MTRALAAVLIALGAAAAAAFLVARARAGAGGPARSSPPSARAADEPGEAVANARVFAAARDSGAGATAPAEERRPTRLEVRAVAVEDLRPVADARVELWNAEVLLQPLGTTDARGLLVTEVDTADWADARFLTASKGNATSGRSQLGLGIEGSGVLRLELLLIERVRVAGVVVDGEGQPVPNATVAVRAAGRHLLLPEPAAVEPTRSDFDGSFALDVEGLPLRYALRATAGERRSAEVFVHIAGFEARPLELRLLEPLHVVGLVTDAWKTPVPGAEVWIAPQEAASLRGARSTSARANERGQFHARVEHEGSYWAVATAPGFCASDSVGVALRADAPLADGIRLTLVEGASITGRVHDETGAGIPGVKVSAHAPPEALRGRVGTDLPAEFYGVAATVTDAHGAYTLSGLRPHRAVYTVSCDLSGPTSLRCEKRGRVIAPRDDVDFEVSTGMEGVPGIQVQVRKEDTGEPLVHVHLSLYRRADDRWQLVAQRSFESAEGRVALDFLEAGTEYTFAIANAPGYLPVVGPTWIARDRVEAFDVALLRPREVAVTVAGGRSGDVVEAAPSAPHPGHAGLLYAPVTGAGRSTLHLWPGEYTLRVLRGATSGPDVALRVGDGPTATALESAP